VGQVQFIAIHLVYKQCGCNYHTDAIRIGPQDFVSHWFNGAHLHVSTSDRTPGGYSPPWSL